MAWDEAAVAEVQDANESFYRAFNNRDMDLMTELWADSEDITCVHPGWNLLRGRDTVLGSWRSILGNPNQPRIVSGGAEVSLFDNLALVICRELVSGSPLLATNVYMRQEGEWKLLHHHSGAVMAGA